MSTSQTIQSIISVLSDFSKKISDDMYDLNGSKNKSVEESLSPEFFEDFKKVQLPPNVAPELQQMEAELRTIYSQFITTNPNDTSTYSTVHKKLSLVSQKIVGLLDDAIASIDGEIANTQPVTAKDKIVQMVIKDLSAL
ncbi:hypothetical protein EIN_094960 [Entamoeba invadens IP1]|uniref:Uncharacterized protein n=1 Tax=Entamoeba invadens IP1 TaxID=370355 RepID=A0A0A1U055_ENTIV|nr:hypothetical protein EIN_094960 [Entamoeba invadens IP1]ELP87259.1 hypothetical protein EIN_094960 [Entamoeba invadens IP1]|eukprot:XP_004254030.1 hypothetical protein EIN_094960 [Entamoeba invadens IP1]